MSVISGFYAESSAVVQGKSCVVRAVSHGSDIDRSGGSCGKHTSPARLARSQPDVGTQHANVGYPGVDFSMASKQVFLSSGLAVSNEHAVKSLTLISMLSHQLRCKANLASSVLSLMDLMWPCLVEPVKRHVACTSRKISTWCGHAVRTCWLSEIWKLEKDEE